MLIRLIIIYKRAINNKKILIKGAAGTFAAIIAISAAFIKEIKH